MPIDILDNPNTNQSDGSAGGREDALRSSRNLSDILTGYLDTAGSVIGAGVEGVSKIGKYLVDTAVAEKNNVPYGVRLSVAGSRKGEDKLRTLRQTYPDAMPSGENDFTFIDKKSGKRVTLDDPGFSIGDLLSNIPEIGEILGGTVGSVGGGILGSAGGPVGTGVGSIAGGGVGAAVGERTARELSKNLGSLLSGKGSIDTRTGKEQLVDFATTTGLNAAFTGVPLAARAIRNVPVKKYLTDKSAEVYKYFKEKGYLPTLNQVGSDAGKELNDNLIANRLIKPELHNQELLSKNLGSFLGGSVDGLSENQLANKLREDLQESIAKKYGVSKEAYANINFSNDVINPAGSTKSIISSLGITKDVPIPESVGPKLILPTDFVKEELKSKSKKVIMPSSKVNPDLDLSEYNYRVQKILDDSASESDLNALRSDIKTTLRDRDLKYDRRGLLESLEKSLTDDLVKGSAQLAESDRTARSAWFSYKKAQEKLEKTLGKAEGVTDGVVEGSGEGLTAGQNLERSKRLFLENKMGDDSKASVLASQLGADEKKTILGSILQEDKSAKGFENSLEKANQKYNMDRVGKALLNPNEEEAFKDLLKQSQGTRAIPEGFTDRTGSLNSEAVATGLAAILDPSLGVATATGLNIAAKAPGTYGGSGQFATSLLRNNPVSNKFRSLMSNTALGAAEGGEIPSRLNYMPASAYTLPATMTLGQGALGNVGDRPESNMRIPESAVIEALPRDMAQKQTNWGQEPVNLDELMSGQKAGPGGIDLDELMGNPATQSVNTAMPPGPAASTNTQAPPINSAVPANGAVQGAQAMPPAVQPLPQAPEKSLDDFIKEKFVRSGEKVSSEQSLDDFIKNRMNNDDGYVEGKGSSPYQLASTFVGKNEHQDRDVISSFIKKSMGQNIDPQRTAWCAAFVNSVLQASGNRGNGSLASRSFLNYGTSTDSPTQGDIVVLRRGNNPAQGHVGFFSGFDKNGNVLILGGNQSDGVNVKSFPLSSVISYRRPPKISAKQDLGTEI